ncbi:MFS transporter [Actinokineospora sp. PR83]|uniref:MFS transporter n=1 Tax=Actinokineospora sp. PR83 TaxID=2884908 RepID=UPI001F2180ED|nr:MFS transporter [Actinokineospora sp. PR83]MCG8916769.1 MFS transporter [Actinokineospora sp. PR83]
MGAVFRSGSDDNPADRRSRKGRRGWGFAAQPERPEPEPGSPPRRRGPVGWAEHPRPEPPRRATRPLDDPAEPQFETYGDLQRRGQGNLPPLDDRYHGDTRRTDSYGRPHGTPPPRDDRGERFSDRYRRGGGYEPHPDDRRTDRHTDRGRPDEWRDSPRDDHRASRYDDRRSAPHRDDSHRGDPYRDDRRPDDSGPYDRDPYDRRPDDRGPHDRDPRDAATGEPGNRPGAPQYPKKLTVTRVAALRSRQLTTRAVAAFRNAANADGADKSGLTALTYATMLNYASDAAMAVALANTLFFSAASGESKGKVALYLLITVAPFALVAPVIGPLLDRLQRGRRLAMCAVSLGQALMCVVMALHFNDWLLYPAALGKMVLSKSFTVLKAAITPRVLPPEITLAKTNARLTVFGLAAGGVFGAVAAGLANLFDSPGALWFTVVVCVVGGVQALRIPAWVEVTEGEVPASISAHPDKPKRQPMGRHVVVSLWGNGTVRVLTGFLMMFAAFATRAQNEAEPFQQLLMLGLIAGAAGAGSFLGNAIGARVHVGNPEQVVLGCVIGSLVSTLVATVVAGIATAALVGLIGAVASALAKNSLDAVIQDDLPEESRASAFGRSETVLQLGWVLGGATGVLLPPIWWVGFLVVSAMLALGLAQTVLTRRGGSLIPGLGGERPARPSRSGALDGGRFARGGEAVPPPQEPHRAP